MKNRFQHVYGSSAEVAKREKEYLTWAAQHRRMVSSRPPVDHEDDLPEGVDLPADREGCVATFLTRKG